MYFTLRGALYKKKTNSNLTPLYYEDSCFDYDFNTIVPETLRDLSKFLGTDFFFLLQKQDGQAFTSNKH